MRRWIPSALAAALLSGFGGCGSETKPPEYDPTPVTLYAPLFPEFAIPEDNPLTQEGIDLGRRLFFDPILSGDSTLACAGCHDPRAAFTDPGRAFSRGIRGDRTTRNSMPLMNLLWHGEFFWEGRSPNLEDQARFPVPSAIEMDLPWSEALVRLNRHPLYPHLFFETFGPVPITQLTVVQALAQFQRTLISQDSRYDRWLRGEIELTEAEQRGKALFFTEAGDCFHCHGDPLFTDLDYHNNGLDAEFADLGRQEATGRDADAGKFKTPTVRNLVFTAPYMHDGRFETIEDVIRHYNSGGVFSPTVDPLIRVGSGLGLSEGQIADLAAFLRALSDSSFVANPDFRSPFP